MNVTIIKEDKTVVVDGEGINFEFELPSNIWAIQWKGTSGHIEFNDGTPNEELTDFSDYQHIVNLHTEKSNEHKAIDSASFIPETYAEKRANAYPTVDEQMDMLYHDLVDNTTLWRDTIKSVKDAHPK